MTGHERPKVVDALEAYFQHQAGGDYASTRAREGERPGEWHSCCPSCGGRLTISTEERGSARLRCHTDDCDEASIMSALAVVPKVAADDAETALQPEAIPALGDLIEAVEQTLRRFVVMTAAQFVAIALWVIHTHTFAAADASPYISISSAEKQSGKSRLFEVLELLVARPWMTGRVTVAVLARKIDREKPTLLLDESDAAFGGDPQFAEGLRGILNTGHRRSGKSTICVGQGANLTDQDFSTYCPKAFAGIGDRLPDTVVDRSISIRLKRRAPGEHVDRFRYRHAVAETDQLRQQLEAWGFHHQDELAEAEPALPNELSDRAQDAWEPLLAIADLAGGGWGVLARGAAVELAEATADDSISRGVQLLTDIKDIFMDAATEALATKSLLEHLNARDESAWGAWHSGEGMRPRDLARLLRPYGIRPRTVRTGDETPKGYKVDQFEDAWTRLLPGEAPQATHTPHPSPDGERDVAQVADVADFPGTATLGERELVDRLKAEFDATEVAA